MNQKVRTFIHEHCRDYALDSAIDAIFTAAATPSKRGAHIETARELLDIATGFTTQYEPKPAPAPEKQRLWTEHPRVKKAAKKQAANGKRGGNMGSKRCDRCGESKGVTAFERGFDTCRKCAGTSTGRPKKAPLSNTRGATVVPKTPPASNGKRVCMVCDTPKGLDKYDGEARVCRVCESEGLTSGEIE